MERETDDASSAAAAKFEFYSKGHKRMKAFNKGEDYNSSAFSANMGDGPEQKRQKTASKFIDCSDPCAIPNLLQRLDKSKFGSVTEEIEALRARRLQTLNRYLAKELTLPLLCSDEEKNQKREPIKLVNQKVTHLVHQSVTEHPVTHPAHQSVIDPQVTHPAHQKVIDQQVTCPAHIDVIDLDDDLLWNDATEVVSCIINIESDDEDNRDQRLSTMYQKVVLEPAGELPMKDVMVKDCAERKAAKEEVGCLPDKTDIGNVKSVYVGSGTDNYMVTEEGNHQTDADGDLTNVKDCAERDAAKEEVGSLPVKTDIGIVKSVYVGTDNYMVTEEVDHQTDTEGDLADIWKEMTFALECSKDTAMHPATDEHMKEDGEECDHSFVLKDDLGYVCRICGVIQRGIETIFEFIYGKGKRTTRTYMSESKTTNTRGLSEILPHGVMSSGDDLLMTEIVAHPRHSKQMKPHQVEGFNFLCSNLVSDDPGGCILAHAPGSGKTFMIISFMQSFLARYPHARPLVVLPKGILATWKKEFQTWQVEDIPLHDFYTSKAENRPQQLDVLKQWVDQKSILFLGYKQLSTIVCDDRRSKVAADCQDILLKVPTILILDEGHTPRNDDTDVLQSLARVQTPLKVVLSGTLYQNHVREVFNILNLVRPKFLKFKSSQAIVNRIMSRVQISAVRKQLKGGTDSAFFESVEYTLQKDENFKRKVAVIQDLREMTSKVLHYYKGDFLDELPGLVDFTVMLNLSARQKEEVQKLWKLDKFKRISVGSLLYMHPQLKYFSEKYSATGDRGSTINEEKIDEMLEKLDVRHGAKVKFFLNILGLCESVGEKLLVFSQFVQPLKLLERLSVKVKGWTPGKELFMITGDSNSEHREWSMERFNSSPDAKVFFGSIKACGEGISLVGASRILILDVHLNPSVTRQAIGRAFRPGQKRKVHTYRLVAADSPEEEDYITCFRKELIAKMWFEWNESCGYQDFEVKTVDVNECGDLFLESPLLRQDIKVLHER